MTRRVGVLTGGGDCPGLNAVIRAVVRKADTLGWESLGILEGWRGLLENKVETLDLQRVSGILYRGGTILRTSRTNPLKRPDGLEQILKNIRSNRDPLPHQGSVDFVQRFFGGAQFRFGQESQRGFAEQFHFGEVGPGLVNEDQPGQKFAGAPRFFQFEVTYQDNTIQTIPPNTYLPMVIKTKVGGRQNNP